jgi:hypothetical protein
MYSFTETVDSLTFFEDLTVVSKLWRKSLRFVSTVL